MGQMKNRRNYYRLLQVQPDAPAAVIRSSFRTLMRELKQHPDLGGSNFNASLLNEAYGVLMNPKLRAEYDTKLRALYSTEDLAKSARSKSKAAIHSCPFCKGPLMCKARAGESCPACGIPLESAQRAERDLPSRRSISRMKRIGRILYFSAWPGEAQEARMIDLSPKGMRFLCRESLRPGTVLKLIGPHLRASAIVTNLREDFPVSALSCTIGVSFLAVEFEESRGAFLSASA